MAIRLTNLGIEAIKGQAALLPNQPLLHNCHTETDVNCGDIVTLTTSATKKNVVVVKKAGVTDLPVGVVAYNGIKTGFKANDLVTVIPDNGFVYLPAGSASITRGAKLQFNANGQVVATSTASNGYIGIAFTEPVAVDDLIVVQVKPAK